MITIVTTSLASKLNAAYLNGGMDFRAGAPCDPKTPLAIYNYLGEKDKKLIADSWIAGWHNERLIQLLFDGLPA